MPNKTYMHYSRGEVASEIMEFCRGRWVAIEGSAAGKRVFLRYLGGRPLTITSASDVPSLIRRYAGLGARTFYATVNVYGELGSVEALDNLSNIRLTTPFWDIDTTLDKWVYAVNAAEVIAEFLEGEGVRRSVYVLWSGEGAHVRVSEHAFSPELLEEHHPLDVAYAVVEYVLRRVRDRIEAIVRASGGVLKVENLVDVKRVFTAPLSLHRRHDLVAVCLKPDDLPSFSLRWASIDGFKHRGVWREFDVGEADDLAREALKAVGGGRALRRSTRVGGGRARRAARRGGSIGRFQVMAILQAARFYLLTGDMERAKSFGLNRAIFYAWAKHYGRSYARRVPAGEERLKRGGRGRASSALGEEVYVSDRGFFIIGGREQLPEDYDRNVASKVEGVIPYEIAWEAALKYLSTLPKQVLSDPQKFYERAYEPVRDDFIGRVVNEALGTAGREGGEVRKVLGRAVPGARRVKTLLDWVRRG